MATSSSLNPKKHARDDSIGGSESGRGSKRYREARSDSNLKVDPRRDGADVQPTHTEKFVNKGNEEKLKDGLRSDKLSISDRKDAKARNVKLGTETTKDYRTESSYKVRKLAPPRPFPTVPTSVSATGPKSQHKEGKNRICVTRKTALGGYMRRCKDLVIKDGYKELHLYALGAAIPHLARLAVTLPTILPFGADEIHSEVRTGTAALLDELIPEDEDEDISMRSREKSTMSVIIRIGDGDPMPSTVSNKTRRTKKAEKTSADIDRGMMETEQIVFQEGDQDDA